ncbi:MAG: DUF2911 domain-containing protein [Ferruginibacter sp.]
MKYLFSISLFSMLLLAGLNSCAQRDKSKRPSPPATATQKVGETTITINYSQPSVKGRVIGKDLEPKDGQVWRAGANEATVFEIDKDVLVEGKTLPAGKYGFYVLVTGDVWNMIFNKTWDTWGTNYNENDDMLRVSVKSGKAAVFAEKLSYSISAEGQVSLLWGDTETSFSVKEK